jgi:hypothetical protein
VKPERLPRGADHEHEYRTFLPFANLSLPEGCEKILRDYKGEKLSKSHIEYLLARGGYRFDAKDSKNSVDVTLRRLAADRKCEADRVRGMRGNRYWIQAAEPEMESSGRY